MAYKRNGNLRERCEKVYETLHNESDEPVEQAHFRVKAFEYTHGYHTTDRNMTTSMAGIRQQRMMEHLNSYQLK